MLKSLNQPRLGQAPPSPRPRQRSQYASPSPRIATNTTRRKSNVCEFSPTSTPAPLRQVVQYVSRGTQWHSPTTQKIEDIRLDLTSSTTQSPQRSEPPNSITLVPTTVPPLPAKPTSELERSSTKRRQSLDIDRSVPNISEELAPKRTGSAPTAVKFLPAKYEECVIEDLVVLIANMIEELIEINDALPPRHNLVLTRFHSK
jgi:hypothetical protein